MSKPKPIESVDLYFELWETLLIGRLSTDPATDGQEECLTNNHEPVT